MDIETDFIGTVLRHRYVYALEEGPFRCENGSRYYDAEKHIIQFNRNRVSCGTLLLDVNQKILRFYKWQNEYQELDYTRCCITSVPKCNWNKFFDASNCYKADFSFYVLHLPKTINENQFYFYLRGEIVTALLPIINKKYKIVMLKSGEEDICYQIIEKIENNDVALFDFTPGQNYLILF